MSRIQLALNVANLDEAVEFYSKFFRATPAKIRPGYANFAIDEPALKLVLIEGGGAPGSINHLGVEVFSTGEVADATDYLTGAGFATEVEEHTTCCYAVQDKVWVHGPDGASWEVYTVLADSDVESLRGDDGCCATTTAATVSAGSDTASAAACC
ncbi:MAG: ArsI/CadI family heavy metal resistance metalloenzyme [Acidimicrobiales bacterium]